MLTAEAAVLVGPRRLELRELKVPEVDVDDALIRVEACGVCGSDVQPYLDGGGTAWPRMISPPVILGHEVVGRVARVGRDAARLWGVVEGDRVLLERWMPCGRCEHCRSGAYPYCVRKREGQDLFYGGTPTTVSPGLWGGFSEYMYVHRDSVVHRVDGAGSAHAYPLFLPLANSISWITAAGELGLGQSILILGPGPIGIVSAMIARAVGARHVILAGTDKDAKRLALAAQLGATETLIGDKDEVVSRCMDLTSNTGVDVVLDVTNSRGVQPVEAAIGAARRGARIVLAHGHHAADLDRSALVDQIVAKSLRLTGVRSRSRDAVATALELLTDESWRDRLMSLCDPILPLTATARGFEAILAGQAVHASVSTTDSPRLP